jgi:hypothetical protein
MAAGLSLLLLVLATYSVRGRGRLWGGGLVLCGILWLLTNKQMEGSTILHVTHHHGLTIADLSGLAAIALGVLEIWRSRGRPALETGR